MDNSLLQPGEFRGFIVGVASSLVAAFVFVAITRYWSHRSVKSIQRRIKYMEDDKVILDNLSKSDQSILLYSFMRIFGIIMVGCFAFMINPFLLYFQDISDPIKRILNYVIFIIFAILALLSAKAAGTLKQLGKYPESTEMINQKINFLKTRLSKLIDK